MKKLFLLILVTLSLISCKTDIPEATPVKQKYTVTFDSDGGTDINKQIVEEGEKAIKPDDPEKTGFSFNGWYKNETLFDFNMPIVSDITLTAKWLEEETEKDWCEIQEDTDLFSLTYFIHFDGQEVLVDKVSRWVDNHSNFHHLGILKDIPLSSNSHVLYTFDLWITKSENKLKVLKHNGGNPTLKNVYLENGNEIHIVF